MAGEDIVPFDAAKAMDALKIRIRTGFAEMIPDEQWSLLLKKEVDAFFSPRNEPNRYHSQTESPSHFREIVFKELEIETKKKIKELFDGPEWQANWGDDIKGKASEMMKKIIIENSSLVLAKIFGAAQQAMFDELKNRMHI